MINAQESAVGNDIYTSQYRGNEQGRIMSRRFLVEGCMAVVGLYRILSDGRRARQVFEMRVGRELEVYGMQEVCESDGSLKGQAQSETIAG